MSFPKIVELNNRLIAAKHPKAPGVVYFDQTKNNFRLLVVVFADEENEEYYIFANLRNGNITYIKKSIMCKGDQGKIRIWDQKVRTGKLLLHRSGVAFK